MESETIEHTNPIAALLARFFVFVSNSGIIWLSLLNV